MSKSKNPSKSWPHPGSAPMSPRDRVIPAGKSSIIPGAGQAVRDTFSRLDPDRRLALADQIQVDQMVLANLVDDVGVIVSEWISCPPTEDVFSSQDMQAFVTRTIAFLDAVNSHFETGYGPASDDVGKIDRLEWDAWITKQRALAPLMVLINPAWDAEGQWDVRKALHVAKTLSDKKGGSAASDEERTIFAQDRMIEAWFRRTGRPPGLGTTDKAAPHPFFRSLFEDLSVSRPTTMTNPNPGCFTPAEVASFYAEVVNTGGILRAIKRRPKDT
mgnify:CR=1 FL=1